jgi:hypothetical protein
MGPGGVRTEAMPVGVRWQLEQSDPAASAVSGAWH